MSRPPGIRFNCAHCAQWQGGGRILKGLKAYVRYENGKSFGGEVDHRAQQLLKLLVEHYISDGTPVASKALAMLPQVQVSSATVRNVMGDLEALGLVSSPHTSAGKVPPIGAALFR